MFQLESVGPNFLAEVDMDDIERVEVLMPARAVPLYGARASAGAVQITLKFIVRVLAATND